MTSLAQWVEDFRWAMNVKRARAYRRKLMFAERQIFDDALRPPLRGAVIAYPDAIYHISVDDVIRAARAVA